MSQVSDDLPKNNQGQIDEQALKAKLIADHQQATVQKLNFPTEIIGLPSKGLVYPEGHPLSSGTIELKYMTAREEDILSSANLIKSGVVIDKLLQSIIVTPINYDDLIVGDKNGIMIAARVLGYGKEYPVETTCPKCNETTKATIDLTSFDDKEINPDDYNRTNVYNYTLSKSKRNITFRLLNGHINNLIQQELKGLQKKSKASGIDHELTTRLKYIITSVDGNNDVNFIRNFVDNELFALDSKDFREHIKNIQPDVITTFDYSCTECSELIEDVQMPMTTNFFWPRE